MEKLREKRDELNSKVKELNDEKRRLIEDINKLNSVIKEERQNRDKANEEVKGLKEKRVASFEEINKIKKELDELITVLERFKDTMGGSYRMLKEELKQMEWEYQTEVHSIKKEKEIAKSELLYDKKRKLTTLQRKLRDLYTEANVYHGLLINRAKESENHHDTMMKGLREIEKLEGSLDKLNVGVKKAREEADKYHKEYAKEVAELPKEENLGALRSKAEEILANFKSGKKVTMEELALLHKFDLY